MSLISSNGFFQSRRRIYVVLAGLIALYLVSRTAFLLRLPPFIDEATHILWAHEMLEGNLVAGAYDGRWATIQIFALLSLLPLEPLLVGRIVVVISGLFTLLAIILSGKLLFSMTEGLLAGLIYVALPFALFFDRLGLADGLSLAFGAWTLFISIKTVRSNKGYYSVLLAISLIGAILTKTSGIISILFPVIAVGFLLPRDRWKTGIRKIAPAVIAGLLIALTLWIRGAGSSGFFEKTSGSLLIDPSITPMNTGLAASWYWSLLTPIVAIVSVLALIWLPVKQGTGEIWFLESILLITLLPNILLYKIWYPRYLLFTLVPLCLLLARFLTGIFGTVTNKVAPSKIGISMFAILLVAAVGMLAYTDISIITKPDKAPIAERLRWQFIEGWPSGYGVSDLVDFLEREARAGDERVYVMRFFNWIRRTRV